LIEQHLKVVWDILQEWRDANPEGVAANDVKWNDVCGAMANLREEHDLPREIELERDLSPWQLAIAQHYGGGEYTHVTSLGECYDVGDGLFTFLMVELDPKEDCDSEEEARRRLAVSISQLHDLEHVI
jgi:hypothetical protein